MYQCRRGTDAIRVIVLGRLPQRVQNAMLHLLSASAELWRYGTSHYEQRSPDTSTLILELLKGYQSEGINMSYGIEDFRRDYAKEHFKDLTPAERAEAMKDLTPAQRVEAMKNLTPAERAEAMKGLTAEVVLKALSPKELKRLRHSLGPAAHPPNQRNAGGNSHAILGAPEPPHVLYNAFD